MLIQIVRWWLVVEVVGVLALPLTLWLFRRLPDRGYSFAKPLGLLLIGYGAWLLSMLGLGAFGSGLLLLIGGLVGALGVWLIGRGRLRATLGELRSIGGWLVFQEALFGLALWGGLWLRWHDFSGFGAGIQHTEQSMDLALLSGILSSTQFPPQDPWLAPYPINYYYLGYLLIAALVRLSGVSVGVGYTLGIATIYALAATGIAGLLRNLIDLGDSSEERSAGSEERGAVGEEVSEGGGRWAGMGGRGLRRWLMPLLGVALVLIVGNQSATLQVLAGSEKVVALSAAQTLGAVRNGLGARATIALPPPPAEGLGDDWTLTPEDKTDAFSTAWWSSRAVWDTLPDGTGGEIRRYAITEFPVFSFLLGDMHPHVLSLPWSLLALALALNVLRRPSAPDLRTRGGIVQTTIAALVIGGLYAINSWDLPTYLLIYLGALTLLYLRLAPSPRAFFWAHWAQVALATVVLCYAVYLPFHMSFVAPTESAPIGIAPAHTTLFHFVVMFGLFAVPLLALAVSVGGAQAGRLLDRGALPLWLVLIAVLPLGLVLGWPLFVLLPLAVWLMYQAYLHRERSGVAFGLWLAAVGALIVWGVDVIYLRDPYASPRMNTIFKFYYQVWLIWGVAAAWAVSWLLRRLRVSALIWGVPFVVLLISGLVYPIVAPNEDPPERTIDGLAYLAREAPAEQAAIAWVRANTPGDAVIVQAPGRPYAQDTARLSSATGRPTLLGWDGHERLWRRGQTALAGEIADRERDVTTIYTTPDAGQAQSLLTGYGARYVYVGAKERQLAQEQGAPPEALDKFDQFMDRVFEQGDVRIYRMR